MSIIEMIKEHPQVGADFNPQLAQTVKHAMSCSAICTNCATACRAEECEKHDHAHSPRCTRICRECAADCRAALAGMRAAAV